MSQSQIAAMVYSLLSVQSFLARLTTKNRVIETFSIFPDSSHDQDGRQWSLHALCPEQGEWKDVVMLCHLHTTQKMYQHCALWTYKSTKKTFKMNSYCVFKYWTMHMSLLGCHFCRQPSAMCKCKTIDILEPAVLHVYQINCYIWQILAHARLYFSAGIFPDKKCKVVWWSMSFCFKDEELHYLTQHGNTIIRGFAQILLHSHWKL